MGIRYNFVCKQVIDIVSNCKIPGFLIGLLLFGTMFTDAISSTGQFCDMKYEVTISGNSIVVEFQNSIAEYNIELISSKEGLLENPPKIDLNKIEFKNLEKGEYYIRLKTEDCQLIIGDTRGSDKTRGLIIN